VGKLVTSTLALEVIVWYNYYNDWIGKFYSSLEKEIKMADQVVSVKPEDQALAEAKKESTRRQFRNDKWTAEQVAARRAELTKDAAPEGWIKVSDMANLCREAGVPISKMVRAFGGDRGMDPVKDPVFQLIYVGRTRYLPPEAKTKGLELLKQEGFAATERKPREKKEKPADGTGPVKDAKSIKPKVSVRPAPPQ
jgi:hypothetical protein